MRSYIYLFAACTLLAAVVSGGASAAVTLYDPLDGSTLGAASGISWGQGNTGAPGDQAACFDMNSFDRIVYGAPLFPQAGTISFWIKGQFDGYDMVLDTIGGASGTVTGDWQIGFRPDNTLRFNVYANGTWNRLKGTTAFSSNTWNHVALSFGSNYGMKLYVNGVAEGAFEAGSNYLGGLRDSAVYAGDYDGDGATKPWAFTGCLDDIMASDCEADGALISAQVPEPGSLAALAGGLVACIPAMRRRRK